MVFSVDAFILLSLHTPFLHADGAHCVCVWFFFYKTSLNMFLTVSP